MRWAKGLGSAAVLLLAGLTSPAAQPSATDKPSVVLIMTDDMGYADIGSYGATDIRTPNIDSLARDGVKLTDFYANAMSCTPTRVALISGRYQQRYGLELALQHQGRRDGERGLRALDHSLPLLLRKNGYATALIGKWHLGYKPEFGPRLHGFDYFYGHKGGVLDYYTHVHPETRQPDLWENETLVQDNGYLTDLITRKAVDFVADHAGRPVLPGCSLQRPAQSVPGSRQARGTASARDSYSRRLRSHDGASGPGGRRNSAGAEQARLDEQHNCDLHQR